MLNVMTLTLRKLTGICCAALLVGWVAACSDAGGEGDLAGCDAVCDCVCGGGEFGGCVTDCLSECELAETPSDCMRLEGALAFGCDDECEQAFAATDLEAEVEPPAQRSADDPCEDEKECDACDFLGQIPAAGGTVAGSTSGTSTQSAWCGGGFSPEDVYAWTPDLSGLATLTTCGSSFDTVLYVRANSCSEPGVIECNDDACPAGYGSQLTLHVTAGTTYYIFVDGIGRQSGGYVLEVTTPLRRPATDSCEPGECGGSGGDCFCDADCVVYDDCCADACVVCGTC